MYKLKNILRYPLFLLTIPLFIIVHIEQQYHHLINYHFVYRHLLWLFVPPVIVFLLSYLVFRNMARAGIFSFVLLFINYFFGDLKDGLIHHFPHSFISKYIFLLPLVIVVVIATFFYLKKKKSSFTRLSYYINLVFFLFIAGDLAQILFNSPIISRDPGDHNKALIKKYVPCDTCQKPDIYYFVFDAYTSSLTLQTDFNYINPVDTLLRNKGFFVIPHSRSNYNLTPFSITSSLDLDYLPNFDHSKDFYMWEYLPGLYGVYKNELVPILQKEGYTFINHSIFDIENFPPITPPVNVWDGELLYTRMNIFYNIDKDIGWLLRPMLHLPKAKPVNFKKPADQRDDHFNQTFNALAETINTNSDTPRFVYTHFLIPHGPYSLDSTGHRSTRYLHYLNEPERKQAYLEQLKFSNRVMVDIADRILSHKDRPSVIIIQGDHSHRIKNDQAVNDNIQFTNFSAVYFDSRDYSGLKDSMTNVNTFRVVLNTLFHQQYPMLKDSSYFLNYK